MTTLASLPPCRTRPEEAEALQAKERPYEYEYEYWLYSVPGYHYCDLLLAPGVAPPRCASGHRRR